MGLPQQRQNLFSQFSSANTNVCAPASMVPRCVGLGEAGQPERYHDQQAGVLAGGRHYEGK